MPLISQRAPFWRLRTKMARHQPEFAAVERCCGRRCAQHRKPIATLPTEGGAVLVCVRRRKELTIIAHMLLPCAIGRRSQRFCFAYLVIHEDEFPAHILALKLSRHHHSFQ